MKQPSLQSMWSNSYSFLYGWDKRFFFFFIKILIYNITHETKKSQSPGTENLRCLGIQKKKKKEKKKQIDLKGLNKLHKKNKVLF